MRDDRKREMRKEKRSGKKRKERTNTRIKITTEYFLISYVY